MTKASNYPLNHILPLAKKLIWISSTADNNTALKNVLDIAKKELQGYFPIEEFESNGIPSILVHNTNKRTKHFKIILNAHLDVVPGKPEQFYPEIKGEKLFGRGAYDMKAAAAVMIVLFKDLAKKISYPIALQIVTDEETYSKNTTQYQIKKGIRGEFIIAGENSDLQIKYKAKAALWIKLTVKGKTAHGGYPWRGENALLKLTAIVNKLLQIYPVPSKEEWITTINVAKIDTKNTAYNAVPDEANAYLDIRYTHEDKDIIMENLRTAIPEDVNIEIVTQTIPTFVSPKNKYVQLLSKEIETITNKKGEIKEVHATSDIRFYNEVGCLGVEFGPKGKDQHGDDEWVDIKSLEDYYNILKNFLLSLH